MKSKTLTRLWYITLGLATSGPFAPVTPTQAQVVRQWTHQSDVGESSAAVPMGEDHMFVADNEDEVLRLYHRFPDTGCAAPVYSFNARPHLSPVTGNPETDLEAAVKLVDGQGTRIYWLGSHSNSKTGKYRPDRFRLFATQVSGDGTTSPPYVLGYVGRYDHLRDDLIAWDQANRHGLGANYFALAASAATGIIPTWSNGFNIEGLVMASDGTTAYVAFRAPLVNGSGPTTPNSPRTHALIVPLLNMPALVAGSPTPGPGRAQFGAPITLDLGGRGVRSIDSTHPGHYLITAGPTGDPTSPPIAPNNFRLFTWTGEPQDAPVEQPTEFPVGLSPEGAMVAPGPITSSSLVQFVSDGGFVNEQGNICWHSFTTYVGILPGQPETNPRLKITLLGGSVVISWPAWAADFHLEHCTDLVQPNWVANPSPVSVVGDENRVTERAQGAQFYRLAKP